jgi:hypothetical protein
LDAKWGFGIEIPYVGDIPLIAFIHDKAEAD